ncbi:MAG: acetyltransferase [Nostoc sp.]|uniref:acetyltransferase n=1 Tax=Nostoc sp. TaxID=1180 RepID=UPI002FF518EC
MLLQEKESGNLVEILDIEALFSPKETTVKGQYQVGEEEQDPESFEKRKLNFPSGESLPQCWIDTNYKSA